MNEVNTTVKYPHVHVKLVGQDGNAFFIIGRVSAALRKAGVPEDVRKQFSAEAKSGDYNNLLATCMKWVDCD